MQPTVEISRRGKDNFIMIISLQLGICGRLTLAIHCHQSDSVYSPPQSITKDLGWKGPQLLSCFSPLSQGLFNAEQPQPSQFVCRKRAPALWPSLCGLLHTCSSMFTFLLCWGPHTWTQCHSWGLMRADWSGRIPSLDLLAGLLLQPGVPECMLLAHAHLSSTGTPMSFSAQLLPITSHSPVFLSGFALTQVQHLALGFVELHEVLVDPLLKFLQVPPDAVLSFCCVGWTGDSIMSIYFSAAFGWHHQVKFVLLFLCLCFL